MDTKQSAFRKFWAGLFSAIVYYIVGGAVHLAMKVLLGFRVDCDPRVKRWKHSKGAFVVLSAHPSEMDAAPLVAACFPRRLRIVAGERQLYRKNGLGWLFRTLNVIPKKQFLPDLHAVRMMMSAVKQGEVLAMMPEGRVSFDGTPSPIDYATAKLLKKLNVPVAGFVPQGTYYVMPPYFNKGIKAGPIRGRMTVLLDEGEAAKLTVDEIYDRIVTGLKYDESALVRETGRRYGPRRHVMRYVARLFYRCPCCGGYRTVTDDGAGTITCSACDMVVHADRNMQFHSAKPDIPANVTEWNAFQKETERKFFSDPEAAWSAGVEKRILVHLEDANFTPAGNGTLTLDRQGFHYADESETLEIPLQQLTGVSSEYRDGTITVFRDNCTYMFQFDHRAGSAQFVNSLMVLRELYLRES